MKIIGRIIQLLGFALLLFVVLVRSSVWTHYSYQLAPWICVGVGVGISTLSLVLMMTIVYKWISGNLGSIRALKWRAYMAVALISGFCVYGLIFFSENNAKGEAFNEFQSLHPILRVGVSTTILFDRDLLVTDASRSPEDYDKMGLTRLVNSQHYVQSDGFVHAFDIRTNDRSEFRNKLLEYSFQLMGFRTLRHVGTADHLHVGL